ncbi:MAG: type I-E CRISPR-associated protein Cse2/CasB [Actinomycetaceae bacterium]|nr:type I-E CRISPR-associated protein Cse2/CasB [Actinomycetaceae bacterium]
MNSPDDEAVSTETPAPQRRRRLGDVGKQVSERLDGARGLQARYLNNESQGRAELAQLRKAVTLAPGESAAIWHLTSIEEPEFVGDDPTWKEIAVHTAMTLYAVHQQSRTHEMHQAGRGFGAAASLLVREGGGEESSTRKHYNALVTSTTIDELRHHLRTFVSKLRAEQIPLDYAMLADDLFHFQLPGGATKVRLRWSRQYSRTENSTIPANNQQSQSPISSEEN